MCYFTNWAQYRQGDGKFVPEDIEPTLCTHIIFAFGWMKKHKLSSFDASDDTKNGKKGLYERVIDLKKKNPSLKILLAVGRCAFSLFELTTNPLRIPTEQHSQSPYLKRTSLPARSVTSALG